MNNQLQMSNTIPCYFCEFSGFAASDFCFLDLCFLCFFSTLILTSFEVVALLTIVFAFTTIPVHKSTANNITNFLMILVFLILNLFCDVKLFQSNEEEMKNRGQ